MRKDRIPYAVIPSRVNLFLNFVGEDVLQVGLYVHRDTAKAHFIYADSKPRLHLTMHS